MSIVTMKLAELRSAGARSGAVADASGRPSGRPAAPLDPTLTAPAGGNSGVSQDRE